MRDWPEYIFLPCAALATFDEASEMGYRCMQCGAIVGSVGQPDRCKEEADKWKTLEAMGGRGWDYKLGEQKA
jgi:transcription initiation factor IIE alpha subunit